MLEKTEADACWSESVLGIDLLAVMVAGAFILGSIVVELTVVGATVALEPATADGSLSDAPSVLAIS